MLQQILRDMYIDPELLAELDETQKQTLFCRMREEQVRRWRQWDQKVAEELKIRPPVPKRNKNYKRVHWLLDEEGEPKIAIIDDYSIQDRIVINNATQLVSAAADQIMPEDDTKKPNTTATVVTPNTDPNIIMVENQNQNNNNQELFRIPMEQDCNINNNNNKSANNNEILLNSKSNGLDESSVNSKSYDKISPSFSLKLHEKRGALQELSLNHNKKVQNVAKRVAEWEQKLTEKNNSPPSTPPQQPPPIPPKPSSVKKKEELELIISETEEQEDQIWREQQKKAKEAEIRMRRIARCAREEHRRSLIEVNSEELKKLSTSNYSQVCIVNNKVSAGVADMRKKPPCKDAIIEWFKCREIGRGACYDPDTHLPYSWFHGLITRQEAESVLFTQTSGTFLVRLSEKIWGYAVSYKDTSSCKHYLIDASNGHYRFFGTDTVSHNTLNELIKYHSVRPITVTGGEILSNPCCNRKDLSDMFSALR